MLYSDAHFVQGLGHLVCEDYAVAGGSGTNRAWAVVSDGCSGSSDSDVGARVLAFLAHARLTCGDIETPPLLHTATRILAQLGAPTEALDATLGWVVCEGDSASIRLVGDGFWSVLRADSTLEWTRVTAVSGAPRYLSYDQDDRRLAAFRAMSENGLYRVTRGVRHADGTDTVPLADEGEDPRVLSWETTLHPGDQVALFSDGVCTLSDQDEPIAAVEVAAELCRVPSSTGRFAMRRLRRFTRQTCDARGWSWFDDIAVGMVARREP